MQPQVKHKLYITLVWLTCLWGTVAIVVAAIIAVPQLRKARQEALSLVSAKDDADTTYWKDDYGRIVRLERVLGQGRDLPNPSWTFLAAYVSEPDSTRKGGRVLSAETKGKRGDFDPDAYLREKRAEAINVRDSYELQELSRIDSDRSEGRVVLLFGLAVGLGPVLALLGIHRWWRWLHK